ncbi:putative Zn finger-like uncharacterized protein [Oxalobacteraceae bacterium GrIS 2.11]
MLLATKCPHCKTTFKVANDQLKLQSGLVRCGICQQVFNGIEHLATSSTSGNTIKINPPLVIPAAVTTSPAKLPEAERSEREFDLFDAFNVTAVPPQPTEEPSFDAAEPDDAEPQLADTFFGSMLSDEFDQAQTKAEFEAKIQALLEADLNAAQQIAERAAALEDGSEEEILLDHTHYEAEPPTPKKITDLRSFLASPPDEDSISEEAPGDDTLTELSFIRKANAKKRVTWMLSIATFLLLVFLIGQATYQFRDLIAAAYPSTKDTLLGLCRLARCQINLPATLDAISYEADELHTLTRENTFEFSLLMRNHSSLVQAWPDIELTLKDAKKQVVLRRVFGPAEYLANPQDVRNGFAANQEQPVKIYFAGNHLQASDYVVATFYP